MKCYQKYKEIMGLTNYGLGKLLAKHGYEITTPALANYDKSTARSIRSDIHVALDLLAEQKTGNKHTFTDLMRQDFLK